MAWFQSLVSGHESHSDCHHNRQEILEPSCELHHDDDHADRYTRYPPQCGSAPDDLAIKGGVSVHHHGLIKA